MAKKRTVEAPQIEIQMKNVIIPMYKDVLKDVLAHNHTHYVFSGGRGSTKSSFISEAIPLLMLANPDVHCVVFRKVGNTMKNSVYAQIAWGIDKLGLTPLFHIPKSISSPIVLKQTGQQILFMGLDDPMKVKSIKLPFGYIGITWFEELDQYSGEKELRTVLQSTMRGGEKFWDFRSFNPPISNLNWANQFALDSLSRENTLVVHNTYLDVPESWLGQAFIDEALDLKATNPKAYEHEYMGVPVGTGGNVFENVEVMYMSDEYISQFDKVYSGIDWGWYPDPFAFVKVYFDIARRNLYIFAEFRANKLSNKATYDILYNEKKLYDEKWLESIGYTVRQRNFMEMDEIVTADSAEPKSISDYKSYGGYGCRGAEKGPDSVTYSMKWLQSLNHIYIDPVRCPETLKEFVEYEYERDKDEEIISGYPDANNHSIDAVRYALERVWKRKGK
ncbi:MAG: PBSX family phage terminase large subunit [Enterococcus sp.]|nr:PBSX family phage terminase large subunit [Enterococcus sp.]